jgi:hypothetical protein
MTEAGRGRRLGARGAIALLALATATGAHATCVSGPGYLFAESGESCSASGAYSPSSTTVPAALFADGVGTGDVPSHIQLDLPSVTVTTSGATYGLYAFDGGTISGPGVVSATTDGFGLPAIYAYGAGSTITLTVLTTPKPPAPPNPDDHY